MIQSQKAFGYFGKMISLLVFLLIIFANINGQEPKNTITFENNSGELALVKLIGATSKLIEVRNQSIQTVNVSSGEYYLLVRYGSMPDEYNYSKGEPFSVEERENEYSEITITLHKVLGGGYNIDPISNDEFENTKIENTTDFEAKESISTPIGRYSYYSWMESIKIWATDDSHDSDQSTAKAGNKYFALHFNIPFGEFSFESYNFFLSDYKIQDRNNNTYSAIGGSIDAGQTYFIGNLEPDIKYSMTPFMPKRKPGQQFYMSSILFEIPECSDSLIFNFSNQSLSIPQSYILVDHNVMDVINSWHENFVFLVKQDDAIQNLEDLKNKDIYIWWTGEHDANNVFNFLKTIGKEPNINGLNVWDQWPNVLANDNIVIFIGTETAGRLLEDFKVKYIRFCQKQK